jgi:hypothetical protein
MIEDCLPSTVLQFPALIIPLPSGDLACRPGALRMNSPLPNLREKT